MKKSIISLWPHQISYQPLLQHFDPRSAKNSSVVLDTSLVQQITPIGLAFTIATLRNHLISSKPSIELRAQSAVLSELQSLNFTNILSQYFNVSITRNLPGEKFNPVIRHASNFALRSTELISICHNSTDPKYRRKQIDSHLTATREQLINKLHIEPKKIGNLLYILQELMKNTADHSVEDAILTFELTESAGIKVLNFAYVEFGNGIKKSIDEYLDRRISSSEKRTRKGSSDISEIYRLAFQSGFTTKSTAVNLGKGLHRVASYIRSMNMDMQVFDASSIGNIAIIGPNPTHSRTRLAFSSTTVKSLPFSYIASWPIQTQ